MSKKVKKDIARALFKIKTARVALIDARGHLLELIAAVEKKALTKYQIERLAFLRAELKQLDSNLNFLDKIIFANYEST